MFQQRVMETCSCQAGARAGGAWRDMQADFAPRATGTLVRRSNHLSYVGGQKHYHIICIGQL